MRKIWRLHGAFIFENLRFYVSFFHTCTALTISDDFDSTLVIFCNSHVPISGDIFRTGLQARRYNYDPLDCMRKYSTNFV